MSDPLCFASVHAAKICRAVGRPVATFASRRTRNAEVPVVGEVDLLCIGGELGGLAEFNRTADCGEGLKFERETLPYGRGTYGDAARVGVTPLTVRSWRKNFAEHGLDKFARVAPGRGRKPDISQDTIEQIVWKTRFSRPEGKTHWSCRDMADEAGVSKDTVARVWSGRGLKPHLVETFKLSNDPRFEEKLVDVVGLYLNPPEGSVVFSVDEKSQCQALQRSQPSLPMIPGRAGTLTHDYKRHGTTTLFAGEVLSKCLPRHRNGEFLKFLRLIERTVPKDQQVHLICDNCEDDQVPSRAVV